MEITVKKYETIYIDEKNMIDITLETLRDVYDIPDHAFIKGENLIVWWNTHGSGYDETIRKATKNDKMILNIMKTLEKRREKL